MNVKTLFDFAAVATYICAMYLLILTAYKSINKHLPSKKSNDTTETPDPNKPQLWWHEKSNYFFIKYPNTLIFEYKYEKNVEWYGFNASDCRDLNSSYLEFVLISYLKESIFVENL